MQRGREGGWVGGRDGCRVDGDRVGLCVGGRQPFMAAVLKSSLLDCVSSHSLATEYTMLDDLNLPCGTSSSLYCVLLLCFGRWLTDNHISTA